LVHSFDILFVNKVDRIDIIIDCINIVDIS